MNILSYHPQTSHEKGYSYFMIPYPVLSITSKLKQEGNLIISPQPKDLFRNYNLKLLNISQYLVNDKNINIFFKK